MFAINWPYLWRVSNPLPGAVRIQSRSVSWPCRLTYVLQSRGFETRHKYGQFMANILHYVLMLSLYFEYE